MIENHVVPGQVLKVIVNILCYIHQPCERGMHDSAYETVSTSDSPSLSGCELLQLLLSLVLVEQACEFDATCSA